MIFDHVLERKTIRIAVACHPHIERKTVGSKNKAWKVLLLCRELRKELEPLLYERTFFKIKFLYLADSKLSSGMKELKEDDQVEEESKQTETRRKRSLSEEKAIPLFSRMRYAQLKWSISYGNAAQYRGRCIVHPGINKVLRRFDAGNKLKHLDLSLRVEDEYIKDVHIDKFLDAFKATTFTGHVEIKIAVRRSIKLADYQGESFNELAKRFNLSATYVVKNPGGRVREDCYTAKARKSSGL